MEERFGAQGSYLVDFYPVCEYLDAAAKAIEPTAEGAAAWMDSQKGRLKSRQADAVIHALQPHLEAAQVPDSEAPVRCCHRYLSQRTHQLDYQQAIEQDLPIGSGKIESAHRYLLQQRLKRAGAWFYFVRLRAT